MKNRRRKAKEKQRVKGTPSSFRIGVLTAVLIFIVASAGVLMFPALDITEVYCEGCVNTKPEDIITSANIETGGNILLANTGRARRMVAENPLIEEVKVRRIFPNKICISVRERTPAAYVMSGAAECAIINKEGIILEIINDDRVRKIVEGNTPPDFEGKQYEEKTDADDGAAEEETEAQEEADESTDITETQEKLYSVPLVAGVEVKNIKEGKIAKNTDEEKMESVLNLCGALGDAGILNRASYIDVTDAADIRLVIENRLDVRIGTDENIGYRTKFLAEVINTKISAYEKAILDYRGDDIYVRPPEDGGNRTVIEKKTSGDEDANEEDAEDDTAEEE